MLTTQEIDKQIAELKAQKDAAAKREQEEQAERKQRLYERVGVTLQPQPIDGLMRLVTEFLDAIGAKYKIVRADGEVYTRGKRTPGVGPTTKYPRGAVTSYVRNEISKANLQPSQQMTVPLGEYDLQAVASATGKYAGKTFGPGNYRSAAMDGKVFLKRLK